MVSSNVKGKEAKLAFLSKFISHIEDVLGISVDVKPSKIVAGLEPEKTRYFLQLFIVAATVHRVDRREISVAENREEREAFLRQTCKQVGPCEPFSLIFF